MIRVVGFDGDDTLWRNEDLFATAQAAFREILADYQPAEIVDRTLLETQERNIARFGYGVKGFVLSMIEAALELSNGQLTGAELRPIIGLVGEILAGPVSLIEGARETLEHLSPHYRLVLITKGDLFEQERKIERSGLSSLFDAIEIVSDKNKRTYQRILRQCEISAREFLMVGNSLRSDVIPTLEVDGHAVWIPYRLTFAHEVPDELVPLHRIKRLENLPALVTYLATLEPRQ
jgi:putative hydrolase of the HAD superfamily